MNSAFYKGSKSVFFFTLILLYRKRMPIAHCSSIGISSNRHLPNVMVPQSIVIMLRNWEAYISENNLEIFDVVSFLIKALSIITHLLSSFFLSFSDKKLLRDEIQIPRILPGLSSVRTGLHLWYGLLCYASNLWQIGEESVHPLSWYVYMV